MAVEVGRIYSPPRGVIGWRCGLSLKFSDHLFLWCDLGLDALCPRRSDGPVHRTILTPRSCAAVIRERKQTATTRIEIKSIDGMAHDRDDCTSRLTHP